MAVKMIFSLFFFAFVLPVTTYAQSFQTCEYSGLNGDTQVFSSVTCSGGVNLGDVAYVSESGSGVFLGASSSIGGTLGNCSYTGFDFVNNTIESLVCSGNSFSEDNPKTRGDWFRDNIIIEMGLFIFSLIFWFIVYAGAIIGIVWGFLFFKK